MNEEDKQLLLQALSAMLLYGVKINVPDLQSDQVFTLVGITKSNIIVEKDNGAKFDIPLNLNFKPYLRSLLSITEEKREELRQEHIKDEQLFADCIINHHEMRGLIIPHFAADWCNKNMFDYYGLIPKGLALEAPKQMYKF